jgi:uncharacterized protein YrrD
MAGDELISWRSVVYGTAVLAADGTQVGTVHEVLGSDDEDIFHGIRVAMAHHHDVLLASDDITSMTASAVTSSLGADQIDALPDYDDQATYHLASVGWLRKHLGWKQDSKSDEEPG